MQLRPHFLFNTLNAITVLARDHDTTAVARMLTLLSDLLRDVLRVDHVQLIPLEQELAFARRYLEIELVRFADRLRVREEIDAEADGALVPVFVLQPLIENALRHGIAPRDAGGTVTIGARVIGETLELRVEDDGIGLTPSWAGAPDYGIGLANTAARLAELFGPAGVVEVAALAGGGTRASVRIPLERSRPAAATDRHGADVALATVVR
jgi:LytS/YehU family sensor histidine kinase